MASTVAGSSSSPLDCSLCSKELCDPVYLDCAHLFCRTCIQGRLSCPSCTRPLSTDFSFPLDALTSFLIDTSHEAAESCANCDAISLPMFFCETCQQSLCHGCKTRTHEARMFARHRVVPLEERARVRGRVSCSIHESPYVLFCTDSRRLVCIECFNGRTIETGHSFVSIDQAYRSQLDKLERLAVRMQTHQEERREECVVRERLIGEINEAYSTARNDVWSVCQQVVDTVLGVRERLTKELEEERRGREEECRKQIGECRNTLSSGAYCLLATHLLCSAASVVDFLQLHGELARRIQTLLDSPLSRSPPSAPSTVSSRSELARALDPVLLVGGAWRGQGATWKKSAEGSGGYKGRSGSPVSMLGKYQMMVDLAGAFGALLAKVDSPLREAGGEVSRLTREVQERQRDMTLRKCLLRTDEVQRTIGELEVVRARLQSLMAQQKELRGEMAEVWQEELDRVTRQQMIARTKIEAACSLEDQAAQALLVSRQLLPFAEGIERMTGILDKKRLHPPDPAPMESICHQINTLSPDSNQRCQAIEKEEQQRLVTMEAKRREEEEGVKKKTVDSLKPTKKKEPRRTRLLDQRRERSPGGTDVALLNPFHRHTTSMTSEESESETASVDGAFDLGAVGGVSGQEDGETTTLIREECATAALLVPLRKSKVEEQKNKEAEVARRHTVLCSLHRAIEDYGGEGGGESNLKASDVRRAERSRANTRDSEDGLLARERPVSAPILIPTSFDTPPAILSCAYSPTISSLSLRDRTILSNSSFHEPLPVPAVPFVPQEVFKGGNEKIGAFEARERVLESLKGRFEKDEKEEDNSSSSEEEETLRL